MSSLLKPNPFYITFTYRMYDFFFDKQYLYYTTVINMYQWRDWEMDCRTRECLTSIFFSVSDHAWPRAAALTTVVSHGCLTALISAI